MKEWSSWGKRHELPPKKSSQPNSADSLRGGPGAPPAPDEEPTSPQNHGKNASEVNHESEIKKRAKAQSEEPFTEEEIDQMQALLEEATGNLGKPRPFAFTYKQLMEAAVLYPMRFLEGESAGQNFLWSKDRIPPIAIYN